MADPELSDADADPYPTFHAHADPEFFLDRKKNKFLQNHQLIFSKILQNFLCVIFLSNNVGGGVSSVVDLDPDPDP